MAEVPMIRYERVPADEMPPHKARMSVLGERPGMPFRLATYTTSNIELKLRPFGERKFAGLLCEVEPDVPAKDVLPIHFANMKVFGGSFVEGHPSILVRGRSHALYLYNTEVFGPNTFAIIAADNLPDILQLEKLLGDYSFKVTTS